MKYKPCTRCRQLYTKAFYESFAKREYERCVFCREEDRIRRDRQMEPQRKLSEKASLRLMREHARRMPALHQKWKAELMEGL